MNTFSIASSQLVFTIRRLIFKVGVSSPSSAKIREEDCELAVLKTRAYCAFTVPIPSSISVRKG